MRLAYVGLGLLLIGCSPAASRPTPAPWRPSFTPEQLDSLVGSNAEGLAKEVGPPDSLEAIDKATGQLQPIALSAAATKIGATHECPCLMLWVLETSKLALRVNNAGLIEKAMEFPLRGN